jgi:hypothetical protein
MIDSIMAQILIALLALLAVAVPLAACMFMRWAG